MTCALAASLVVMAARFAGEMGEPVVRDLESLPDQLGELAATDDEAFGRLLAAWKLPADEAGRRSAITAAALGACAVPLGICEAGARVAEQAELVAVHGKAHLVGEAVTAAYLADASVRSAARLVRLNAVHARSTNPVEEAAAWVVRTGRVVTVLETLDR